MKRKIRKDKDGWYRFTKSPTTAYFINDEFPNIICMIYYIVAHFPYEVRSGKLIDGEFQCDGKIVKTGLAAAPYYKNNKELKKLLKKNNILEAA